MVGSTWLAISYGKEYFSATAQWPQLNYAMITVNIANETKMRVHKVILY